MVGIDGAWVQKGGQLIQWALVVELVPKSETHFVYFVLLAAGTLLVIGLHLGTAWFERRRDIKSNLGQGNGKWGKSSRSAVSPEPILTRCWGGRGENQAEPLQTFLLVEDGKFGALPRVSRIVGDAMKQVPEENSIPIQQDQVRAWAKQHGVEIIREFCDAGRSGPPRAQPSS